ncbi:M18 family aminopeptidase [Clostridium sp.]|jgi:aspartyl aminopeptidase|uniref:M18 family aminopeptidase n=1 Tax=Clostridium sp. TaxID=1506 RepID=UPI0025893B3D|nr:M18 family aminopeptidase [Clostridium sp.]MDF2503774.1 aspartyl aminopeptidase [Clostridium sp.]
MCNEIELAENLIDFIYESPSAFHAVKSVKKILSRKGFMELKEGDRWELQKGGKYFVIRNDSAIISFVVGSGIIAKKGFKIIGAHTDSPSFRIKPCPEITAEKNYIKLNTEVYGGPILNTWLDRPLSLAGRVTIKGKELLYPEAALVNIKRPIMIIPNLAIHMNRAINKGVELNRQIDVLPLLGLINDTLEKDNLLVKTIAKEFNIAPEEILDFDLFLYEYDKGNIMGLNNEFVSSSRLDDLEMVHAGLIAFADSDVTDATNVLACFDNEEVGSSTKQGADSEFLASTLERIVISFGGDREDYFRSLYKSFMISADAAHAVHPNRGDKSDPTNRPIINKGPVIKISSNQKYTSDSNSISVYEELCKNANVPVQKFVNRSDEVGGSTIGPISSTHVGIRTVDMGTPLLAMHSVRELCGIDDHLYVKKSFEEFYKL